jgi:hypothetical protein
MFIKRSYFIGEINIPNTSGVVGELLDVYIAKYEKEFLIKLLGLTNYNALVASNPLTVQKWINLVEGIDYSYYGQDYTYYGLAPKYSDNTFPKESPIANYIYYWFMRGNLTQTASTGENKPTNENANGASPGHKMVRAWNEISRWEVGFRQFIAVNSAAYNLPLYPYPFGFSPYYFNAWVFAPINEFNL